MRGRDAKPGKPGVWNGRKQRWRTYVRAFKKMDPGAAQRVAQKEIEMKARLVRLEAIKRWANIGARAAIMIAALGALATLQCAVHSSPRPAAAEVNR